MSQPVDILKKIRECCWYRFGCKEDYPTLQDMIDLKNHVLADEVQIKDGGAYWLISCTSHVNAPASLLEIQSIEQIYKAPLSEEYRNFLLKTNGASLFTYQQRRWGAVTRCEILTTSEILALYKHHIDIVGRHDYEDMNKFKFNFVPVAHVMDSFYICISTHSQNTGTMFMLYPQVWGAYPGHEWNGGYPEYTDSFDKWLNHVIDTHGNEWANGENCH